jgi:superfamily I DNA/RNA helicase
MTPDKIPCARQETILVSLATREPAPFSEQQEVFLRYVVNSDQTLIGDGKSWYACEVEETSRTTLAEILHANLPRLACVTKVNSKGSSTKLTILLSIFPALLDWQPQTFAIGADEKISEKVRSRHFLNNSAASMDRVAQWLADALVCPDPLDSEKARAAISYGRTKSQRDSTVVSFTIWGNRVVADITLQPNGRLRIENLVKGRQKDDRGLSLLHAPILFQDASQTAEFRNEYVQQLREITSTADSYLGMWRRYNDLETEMVLKRARDRGVFRYSDFEVRGGRFEFAIELDAASMVHFDKLAPNDKIDFDAADGRPLVIEQPQPGVSLQDQLKEFRRTTVGHIVKIDLRRRQLTIEHENPDLILDSIPLKGYLFPSLGGDSRRLRRRDDAESRIRAGANPMPQLGLLLEGQPVTHGRFKTHKALSAKTRMRKLFASDPTDRQLDALEVALSTPDIALIQGPPGTGKTQVIAALQARLAEIADSDVSLAGQILLTAYQHDAVVQVASRTEVFGLPAVNLSRRKGRTAGDGVEAWKTETVQAVRSRLEQTDGSQYSTLRQLRERIWAHMHHLAVPEVSLRLLSDVEELTGETLPAELRSRISSRMRELRRISAGVDGNDDDLEVVLIAVRGLHTTVDAFLDDGAAKAHKVLARLKPLGLLTAGETSLLETAADWSHEEAPAFLGELDELKIDLLNRLISTSASQRHDFNDETTRGLLAEAVAQMDRTLSDSRAGISGVLTNYLSELENNPEGVRLALSEYTVVLAATCQQADSPEISTAKGDSPVFESVIVDEAARANPLDLLIPMSMAKRRIILVGDHRQLPQILDEEVQRAIQADKDNSDLDPLRESLFERLFKALKESKPCRTVTLDTQFRMHEDLGNFVSRYFYEAYGDPKIRSVRPPEDFHHSLPGYEGRTAAWLSVPLSAGPEKPTDARSWFRPVEAQRVAKEIAELIEHAPDLSFGIISFYGAQVEEIWRQFENLGVAIVDQGERRIIPRLRYATDHMGRQTERVQIGTVDSFQGMEFDVVVLSLTRANSHPASEEDEKKLRQKYGFLTLVNRLCVAMSRQRRLLIVAGDEQMAIDAPVSLKNLAPLKGFLDLCRGSHGSV